MSSNPFRLKGNTSHQARKTMDFFWGQDALNGFTQPPFEFAICKRIKDTWYSKVVDECRAGDLSDDTYNFLHGYPTSACGSSLLGQSSTCGCQAVIDAALDALRRTWMEERKQNPTACIAPTVVIGSSVQTSVSRGLVPETTAADVPIAVSSGTSVPPSVKRSRT